MQAAGNTEGILAMAESMLAKNPQNPVALKVRVQVYSDAKDYAKVIELAPEAAEAQPAGGGQESLVYLMLGAAYNAREMKPQAIAAFGKVTAGPRAGACEGGACRAEQIVNCGHTGFCGPEDATHGRSPIFRRPSFCLLCRLVSGCFGHAVGVCMRLPGSFHYAGGEAGPEFAGAADPRRPGMHTWELCGRLRLFREPCGAQPAEIRC